jgi:hypothetical protein
VVDHIDDTLRHAIDSLRELPPLDRAAVARITAVAAGARARDLAGDVPDAFPARRRLLSLRAAIGLAAAAAVVGFVAHALLVRPDAAPPQVAASGVTPAAGAVARTVAANPAALELAPVPTQFVLERRDAHSVSLVGDFNGWGAERIELERAPGSSLWAVSVPIVPGRHSYAFMVDDTLWTVDPRAPRAKDADFGVAGSVVIVGRP